MKSFGDAELYDRGGKKVLRLNGGFVGKERINNFYDELHPLGDVLMIGLGMGTFFNIHKDSIDSLKTIELSQNIIDMYNDENEPDDKHTIVQGDGFEFIENTSDTFDYILFDIESNAPGRQLRDRTISFIDNAMEALNDNSKLVINAVNTAETIIDEYGGEYSSGGSFVIISS